MAHFDGERNTLTLKLVYYGPALSGKTTNLTRLHERLLPEFKGELMVMDNQRASTLFLDLLPLAFRAPSGLLIKCKLFTVPGQVLYDSTRLMVLNGADAVAFVADSRLSERAKNAESFANLQRNCTAAGIDFERLPLVIQFNKRDLEPIVPEEELRASWVGSTVHFSAALQGKGVVETLVELLRALYPSADQQWQLQEAHGVGPEAFVDGLTGGLVEEVVSDGV